MQKRNRLRVARLSHIPVRLNFRAGLHNLQMRHVHGRPTVGYYRPMHATVRHFNYYLGQHAYATIILYVWNTTA